MSKKLTKENLQLLVTLFNEVEAGKRLVQDIADEEAIEMDDVIDSLEEAEEQLWHLIEDFVHNPENY